MTNLEKKVLADAIWVGGSIATMTSGSQSLGVIEEGAILVSQGKISWIGPKNQLPAAPAKLAHKVYELEGRWVTPGLIDCHTHLVYAGNRANEFSQRLHGASYQEIAQAGGGIRSTVNATRAASKEDLLKQTIPRLKALLAEGVTTIEIKSGYGLDETNERKILEVAAQLEQDYPVTIIKTFLGVHALPLEYADRRDEYVDYMTFEVLPALHKANLVQAVDAFCETIAFSPQQVEKLFLQAQKLNLPVKLHAEQLSDLGGAGLAAKYQALSADHIEYISEDSIKKMAASNTVAVLLPGAFYYLREKQLPPIQLLRQYNVPMAIATDCNPGTSPITSLLLILNMACTLFHLTPEEALAGVTCHAAQALGLQTSHGSLAVGKCADMVVWDIESPIELVYAIGLNRCDQIIKNGLLIQNK